MGIHAGIYMAAALLSAPVLTAGSGANAATGTMQTSEMAEQTDHEATKSVQVSFDAPGGKESGEAGNQMENETGRKAVTVEASVSVGAQAAASVMAGTADVSRFVLPEEARVLVVVEGTGASNCDVYAFERSSTAANWEKRVETTGHLGMNGMSNHRQSGDKTTPIGVFKMNTPFGQAKAEAGFPSDYIQVDTSYVWEDDSNRLVKGSTREGEQVGTSGYAGYYDYVIDAGFNPNGIKNQGSALFLHCSGEFKNYTSGCVAIDREQMKQIMQLYGKYGSGASFIAQAPKGTFGQIYNTYGVNQGLSPDGNF